MVYKLSWIDEPLTEEQAAHLFFLTLQDDLEDSPWMVMGDLQFWSASSLAHSLRNYAHEQKLPWYVASMLPIRFQWPGMDRVHQLSPDIFVAFVPERPHQSFNVSEEGGFPPFVLEVVSPSSSRRDRQDKLEAYHFLKVKEYLLFTPRLQRPATLQGYRRAINGQWEPTSLTETGKFWSEVLGLNFVVNGKLLQAQTLEGRVLLTPEESEEARRRAEVEIEQLRQEIARLKAIRDE